jgi:hypothetical protein
MFNAFYYPPYLKDAEEKNIYQGNGASGNNRQGDGGKLAKHPFPDFFQGKRKDLSILVADDNLVFPES